MKERMTLLFGLPSWFATIYMPLFLTLWNELIDAGQAVCADFSQGDEYKFGHYAGKECMVMVLTPFACS